ncbi:MAG: hypothetical protein ACYC6Y_29890, partial [Thermoguttaceae bacterium]
MSHDQRPTTPASQSVRSGRREFLRAAGALPALAAASLAAAPAAGTPEPLLPQVAFGKYRLSRLVCGANPFNGGSHLSTFVNRQMKD